MSAELRPIPGPGALGGGRRRFFELLALMAGYEFKRTYYGTVLGYLWSLLRPFILFGILLLVFTRIFRVGAGIENYEVMLLLNVVLFGFFQEATTNATPAMVRQERIVRKTQFPRLVIPLAHVVTGLMNLGMNMIAVVVFALAFGVEPGWGWLPFLLLVALLALITAAAASFLCAAYVRHRDTLIIWSVLAMALFYGSAVLYPIEIVEAGLADILLVNPLTLIFVQAREWFVDPGAPGIFDVAEAWQVASAGAIVVALCAAAAVVFSREARRAAEDL